MYIGIVMRRSGYSKECFWDFLENMSKQEVGGAPVVADWKSAAEEMLPQLNSKEEKDLRGIDIEGLGSRFARNAAESGRSITPWVIHQYKHSLSSAIGDFIAYRINPQNYKSSAVFGALPHGDCRQNATH